MLRARADVLHHTRQFFRHRGFLEVQTPTRLAAPALEDYIDAEPSGSHWLRTSPELHMKRLLGAGVETVFQIGPCFRRGETGSRHLPEFTMLEWYRADADWLDVLADTKALIREVARKLGCSEKLTVHNARVDLAEPWEQLTLQQAFETYASADLDRCVDDGTYEQVLVTKVEPNLGVKRPTILTEYPAGSTGLSKNMPAKPNRAERWELYVAGIELANACSELIDPVEQRRRFETCARQRAEKGKDVYPLDEAFLEALCAGLPPCAGVALGLDRLVMVLADAPDIQHVVAFPDIG